MPNLAGFANSVFTTKGKTLFTSEGDIKIKVSSFAYSTKKGSITEDRVDQSDIRIKKAIPYGSNYNLGDSIGYKISTRLDAFELADSFEIEEVGLYAIDPATNSDVLVWVGELTYPTPYNPNIDLSIDVYMPLTNRDISVELFTNPTRVSDHNDDINSHKHLRELVESNKYFGKDVGEVNAIVLDNPTWVGQFKTQGYQEPKVYLFTAKNENTGAVTFKEEGKEALPLYHKGEPITERGLIKEGKEYYSVYRENPTPHFDLLQMVEDIEPPKPYLHDLWFGNGFTQGGTFEEVFLSPIPKRRPPVVITGGKQNYYKIDYSKKRDLLLYNLGNYTIFVKDFLKNLHDKVKTKDNIGLVSLEDSVSFTSKKSYLNEEGTHVIVEGWLYDESYGGGNLRYIHKMYSIEGLDTLDNSTLPSKLLDRVAMRVDNLSYHIGTDGASGERYLTANSGYNQNEKSVYHKYDMEVELGGLLPVESDVPEYKGRYIDTLLAVDGASFPIIAGTDIDWDGRMLISLDISRYDETKRADDVSYTLFAGTFESADFTQKVSLYVTIRNSELDVWAVFYSETNDDNLSVKTISSRLTNTHNISDVTYVDRKGRLDISLTVWNKHPTIQINGVTPSQLFIFLNQNYTYEETPTFIFKKHPNNRFNLGRFLVLDISGGSANHKAPTLSNSTNNLMCTVGITLGNLTYEELKKLNYTTEYQNKSHGINLVEKSTFLTEKTPLNGSLEGIAVCGSFEGSEFLFVEVEGGSYKLFKGTSNSNNKEYILTFSEIPVEGVYGQYRPISFERSFDKNQYILVFSRTVDTGDDTVFIILLDMDTKTYAVKLKASGILGIHNFHNLQGDKDLRRGTLIRQGGIKTWYSLDRESTINHLGGIPIGSTLNNEKWLAFTHIIPNKLIALLDAYGRLQVRKAIPPVN
jgi:hypothetical protein